MQQWGTFCPLERLPATINGWKWGWILSQIPSSFKNMHNGGFGHFSPYKRSNLAKFFASMTLNFSCVWSTFPLIRFELQCWPLVLHIIIFYCLVSPFKVQPNGWFDFSLLSAAALQFGGPHGSGDDRPLTDRVSGEPNTGVHRKCAIQGSWCPSINGHKGKSEFDKNYSCKTDFFPRPLFTIILLFFSYGYENNAPELK